MEESPMSRTPTSRRGGAAAVELAYVLPFLALIFMIAVDWSRIFYFSVIVTNCARNGALWASDPSQQALSPYADITAAALADAPDLNPQPTVTQANGSDASGPYVDVTVSYTFNTLCNFPGIPRSTDISRTMRMGVAQAAPNSP
jgi:Flp pilus assembly protein TadG